MATTEAPAGGRPMASGKTVIPVIVVVACLLVAGLVSIVYRLHGVYFAVFTITIIGYIAICRAAAQRDAGAPDSTLVAEQIVTIGVASLVVHIVIAGFELRESWRGTTEISADVVWTSAASLGEGLMCAAFAPLFAMAARMLGTVYDLDKGGTLAGPSSGTGSGGIGSGVGDIDPRMGVVIGAFTSEANRHQEALRKIVDGTVAFAAEWPAKLEQIARTFENAGTSLVEHERTMGREIEAASANWKKRAEVMEMAWQTTEDAFSSATSKIVESLDTAATEIGAGSTSVRTALDTASEHVRESTAALRDDFLLLSVKLNEHGRLLANSLAGISSEMETRGAAIGSAVARMEQKVLQVAVALESLEGRLAQTGDRLPATVRDVTAGFEGLNEGALELAAKLNEGAALLDGLRTLIASVRRFIPAENDELAPDSKMPL